MGRIREFRILINQLNSLSIRSVIDVNVSLCSTDVSVSSKTLQHPNADAFVCQVCNKCTARTVTGCVFNAATTEQVMEELTERIGCHRKYALIRLKNSSYNR
jgi:hypothetical protein